MSHSLSFTGERFLPECTGEIWYEHWHRYALARQLGDRASILDVASGEGYGSAMLAEVADSVVGVDISADATRHATHRYGGRGNLRYITASCDCLPFAPSSFDLVVSFETLEHIATQREFIAEIARVMTPDGLLVISSPNKQVYSDAQNYHNEFHVKELYRDEFEQLLSAAFPCIAWFEQKLLFNSAIWPEASTSSKVECLTLADESVTAAGKPGVAPMYYIAVCSRNPDRLPGLLNKLSLFGDVSETIYQDYIRQTQRVLKLDSLLVNREQLIAERDAYLELRTKQMEERERLIEERDAALLQKNGDLDNLAKRISEQDARLFELSSQVEQSHTFRRWLKLPLIILGRILGRTER